MERLASDATYDSSILRYSLNFFHGAELQEYADVQTADEIYCIILISFDWSGANLMSVVNDEQHGVSR